MESRPRGPVVLTAEEEAILNEGIGLILSRWTAMRAAVDNGWGGRDSQEKAMRTVSNVVDYFTQSKDPTDFDGLADILESGLHELNTVADDGSLEEVTETLLDLYYECLEGNFQRVEKLRLTNPQTTASVVKVSNGNDEEDKESDDEDEDTDMMVDASESCSNRKPEAMPVDEPKADDGWTVVPSRKNKGKRI
uniref:Pre-rRNA-processing protein TSR2-like protein n=1 Tax=Noccaea caerulescens TaxID=107243 RepID=A0A1J3EEF9_NOCCA